MEVNKMHGNLNGEITRYLVTIPEPLLFGAVWEDITHWPSFTPRVKLIKHLYRNTGWNGIRMESNKSRYIASRPDPAKRRRFRPVPLWTKVIKKSWRLEVEWLLQCSWFIIFKQVGTPLRSYLVRLWTLFYHEICSTIFIHFFNVSHTLKIIQTS